MNSNSKQSKKYSVLIVDDQENWRELLTELIDILKEQFEVISVDSYDSALIIIRDQSPPFHVVVTDMRLVDEDPENEGGLHLIKYLKERGDETRTIVVTGYPTFSTQKRALRDLKVYDYLEKRSKDGTAFDPTGFQRIVYQAALEAEKARLEGYSGIRQSILILEPNLNIGRNLKKILEKDGHVTNLIHDIQNLEEQLNDFTHEYALIIMNNDFSDETTLTALESRYLDANIILLTTSDMDSIFNAMRKYPILTATSLPDTKSKLSTFRDLIHSALSAKAFKYISIQTNNKEQQEQKISHLEVGVSFEFTLVIQDKPTEGAKKILILPSEQRKGKIYLDLFIHAEQMRIEPATEQTWEILLTDERPEPITFSITPIALGEKSVFIEIEQSHRPLGRITMKTNVIDSRDY